MMIGMKEHKNCTTCTCKITIDYNKYTFDQLIELLEQFHEIETLLDNDEDFVGIWNAILNRAEEVEEKIEELQEQLEDK